MLRIGTAGNPDDFYDNGGKSSLDMPEYLHGLKLNAYEYQCGRGVKISVDAAKRLGEKAVKYDIRLSVHAPYFTNISSNEPERIDKTINYITQTATAAEAMGAKRIVVHMGAAKDITRREAMIISKSTINRTLRTLDEMGLGSVAVCPETMGKINQMGTLEETLEVCAIDERLIPTIDFGHLNSRTQGGLVTEEDYENVIDTIHKKLGEYRAVNFHSHFSKIEYTAGGEKKHLTFADTVYGPQFEPLLKIILRRKLTPVIICESAGTQSFDAVAMRKEELKNI